MKILIACEESQAVCKAFRAKGFEAFSCDIKPCSGGHPEWHIQGDAILEAYSGKYTLLIGHPPCTYLSYAGTQCWNDEGRVFLRLEALDFFAKLWEAPIPYICLENPKGCASPTIAKYSQEIQPYYFGDPFLKTTWLWLKNLPLLSWSTKDDLFNKATGVSKPAPVYIDKTGKNRHFTESISGDQKASEKRSKTFPGIDAAMADQWGRVIKSIE